MDRRGRPRDRSYARHQRDGGRPHRASPNPVRADHPSYIPSRPIADSSQREHYENPRRLNKRRIVGQGSDYNREELARLNLQPPSKRARPNNYDPRIPQGNPAADQGQHRPQRQSKSSPEFRLQPLPTNQRSFLTRSRPNPGNVASVQPPPRTSQGRNVHYDRNKPASRAKSKKFEIEKDFHRITQRMRQIDIGKATDEYRNYSEMVPRVQRKPHHPRTPNPRHKMPNKWWKRAFTRWRKDLHAFDADKIQKRAQAGTGADVKPKQENKGKVKSEGKIDVAGDFCCEKCSGRFKKFDEWMRHREQCDGTVPEKEKGKDEEKETRKEARLDDEEDEDFDLFRLNQDVDVDIKAESTTEDEEPEIYDGSGDEEEDEEEAEEGKVVNTLSLLDQLNNVLDEDEDGGLL